MKKAFVIALAFAPILVASTGAQAEGWIAQHIIKPIAGEHAAQEADKLHERLGKPLDKALEAAEVAAAGSVLSGKK